MANVRFLGWYVEVVGESGCAIYGGSGVCDAGREMSRGGDAAGLNKSRYEGTIWVEG
jgi:hypothetical protein